MASYQTRSSGSTSLDGLFEHDAVYNAITDEEMSFECSANRTKVCSMFEICHFSKQYEGHILICTAKFPQGNCLEL